MEHEDLEDIKNYEAFRDIFFGAVVAALAPPDRPAGKQRQAGKRTATDKVSTTSSKTSGKPAVSTSNDPAELAEFSDFVAKEIFSNLPNDLRDLSYKSIQEDTDLAEKWSLPLTVGTIDEVADQIPPYVTENLITYGLVEPPKSDLQSFIAPVIAQHISASTAPPPIWVATKTTACEICDRDWIPLTYHHLIPRGVHAKVLKRGWHDESMLNSVAWLCRACHTFVHKMAPNEELAKEWYTVDRICSREDVQKWGQWIGKVRWKKT